MTTRQSPPRKHTVRPYRFRLNPKHSVTPSVWFAYLGNVPGSNEWTCFDSSVHNHLARYRNIIPASDWKHVINRWGIHYQRSFTRTALPFTSAIPYPYTISWWYNSQDATGTSYNFKGTNLDFYVEYAANRTTIQTWTSGSPNFTNIGWEAVQNVWYFLTLFMRPNGWDFYVDGNFFDSFTTTSIDPSYITEISWGVTDQYARGIICDFSMYEGIVDIGFIKEIAQQDNPMLSGMLQPVRDPPTYFQPITPPTVSTGIFDSLIIGV